LKTAAEYDENIQEVQKKTESAGNMPVKNIKQGE